MKTGAVSEDVLLTAFDADQEMPRPAASGRHDAREALADGQLVIATGFAKLLDVSEGPGNLETPLERRNSYSAPRPTR